MQIQKMVTVTEAAELLSISKQCLRDYIRRGMLKAYFGPAGKGPGKPMRLRAVDVANFFVPEDGNSFSPIDNHPEATPEKEQNS